MPTPTSIASPPRSNSGEPLAGGVQAVSATPMERVTELTFSPMRATSSRSAPFSAAAPQAFMTKKFPATPRRPVVNVESCTDTSSSMSRVRALMSSASASSWAISKAIL